VLRISCLALLLGGLVLGAGDAPSRCLAGPSLWASAGQARASVDPATADHADQPLAAQAPDGPFRFEVYWENDGTILKPNNSQDRHYTNANAITLAHQPSWAEDLAEQAESIAFDGDFAHTQSAAGYVIGHQMFTPQDITAEQLIEDDRPYAGYLYGGAYWQRANDTTFDHLELNLGVVGPAARGQQLQNIVHRLADDRDPNGWDNQLSDEPTVQLFVRRRYRLPVHALWTQVQRPNFGVELLPKAELALGTVHRYAEGGVTLRAGWKLPDDFGAGEIQELASATGLDDPRRGWGVYGFASAAGRIVEHNLFLAGNSFTDSHSVEEETLFGRVRAGLALQYRGVDWLFEGVFSQSFLTEAFEQQDSGDAFGQLRVSLTRRF
jgi:hypothetical protein